MFAKYFITTKDIVVLSDDAPDWLRTAVREAHDEELPDDWHYEMCAEAAAAWDENTNILSEEDSDWAFASEWAFDVNAKLLEWYAQRSSRLSLADELDEECGLLPDTPIAIRLRLGQMVRLRHIAHTIWSACAEEEM